MVTSACPNFVEFEQFRTGELSYADHQRVARHLLQCANCQLYWKSNGYPLPKQHTFPSETQPKGPEPTDILLPDLTVVPTQYGPYRILKQIGSGGMGVVFQAIHENLGKVVALKVLTKSGDLDPVARERFAAEAKLVGQLNHENVVQATDANEIRKLQYLAMEFIDGLDVAQLVSSLRALSIADSLEIVRQAAMGLAHAHSKGIVHRDVKPSNLMVTAQGVVKLMDLGLAVTSEEIRKQPAFLKGGVLGTQDYMAPEQWIAPREVDHKADIYGLGGVLYYCLAAQAPFSEAHTPAKKKQAHLVQLPPPIRNRPDIPSTVIPILDRMLAKNPHDRPTAVEVIDLVRPLIHYSQLAHLVARARLVPISSFSDGEPTNPAPVIPATETPPAILNTQITQEHKTLPETADSLTTANQRMRIAAIVLLIAVILLLIAILKL